AAGAAPGGAGVGAGCAAGSAGTATTFGGVCCCGCGTGTVPDTGVDPGGSATGCPLGPRMVPGVVEPPYAGCAPAGGAAGVPGSRRRVVTLRCTNDGTVTPATVLSAPTWLSSIVMSSRMSPSSVTIGVISRFTPTSWY